MTKRSGTIVHENHEDHLQTIMMTDEEEQTVETVSVIDLNIVLLVDPTVGQRIDVPLLGIVLVVMEVGEMKVAAEEMTVEGESVDEIIDVPIVEIEINKT